MTKEQLQNKMGENRKRLRTKYTMFRKRRPLEKPKINMTPMIDVVFLLLTFFVLTFKIIIPEGDFNVRMSPIGQVLAVPVASDSVQVRLIANAHGSLSAIQLNGEDIENFDSLRQHVMDISHAKPVLEIELLPDEQLCYEYVIQAFTAVSPICNNIKFVRQAREDG